MPMVGFVNAGSSDAPLGAAFRKGLSEAGYFEGQNVNGGVPLAGGPIRSSAGPGADLVRRRVDVIITSGGMRLGSLPRRRPRPFRSSS